MEENNNTPTRYPVYTVQPSIITRATPKPPQERSPEEQWKNLERKLKQMSGEV